MLENRAEIEKRAIITVETVLSSIQEKENWWKQLENLLHQNNNVERYISGAIQVWDQLETASQNLKSQLPQTIEEAERIKALWTVSAPGTYFQPFKADRYTTKPWSAWMDRQRIIYSFKIGRSIAEIRLGHTICNNWQDAKAELMEQAPAIIYNGTPAENAAVLQVKKTPWLRIPQSSIYPGDKIFVINPLTAIDNTVDQIKSFRLPPNSEIKPGDEIGVVIHAPQAVRFLYALNNIKNVIPKEVNLKIFPLPTPKNGFPEYPLQELRGTIFYHFIANPQITAGSPYSFKI